MSTRRVVFGKVGGSNFVLRAALPGFDVITDDMNDSDKCAFNSDWDLTSNPLVRIASVGKFIMPDSTGTSFIAYPIPSGLSVPFIDFCALDQGGNVRDDWAFDDPVVFAIGSGNQIDIANGLFKITATRRASDGLVLIKNINCVMQFVILDRGAF